MKPKIFSYEGIYGDIRWVCISSNGYNPVVGRGNTPKESYEDWLRIYKQIEEK